MCHSIPSLHCDTWPKSSTSAKAKSASSASLRIAAPSSPETNSPSSFNNLRAFHSFGLCEAVRMIPPDALKRGTSISTVGVVLNPVLITSIPKPCNVLMTKFSIICPEGRASLPITTVHWLCRSLSQAP